MLARFAVCAWLRVAPRGASRLRAPQSFRFLRARAGDEGPGWDRMERKMALRIYDVAIALLRKLRPVIEAVRVRDENLACQLRRAAASIPLNLSEGAYSQGRNERARWFNAMGSAAEVRACLDVAEALGYVDPVGNELRDSLDRIIATLHRLTRR